MEANEKIQNLEDFKRLIEQFFSSRDAKIRSEINRKKDWVRREVLEARCYKTFTVSPPPAVGGLIMRNVDLFEALFDPPYGWSVKNMLFDMIDETIGVIMSGGPAREESEPFVSEDPDYEEGYAFIAMAIDPQDSDLEDVLDSIKEAATKCGIHAERIDEVQSNNRITDRILESIQKAQFVIVDLTHSKPNVFYEAGYAQGLSKTPIYIARDGTQLEFDLKDYPIIFFKNMRELKERLQKRFQFLVEST